MANYLTELKYKNAVYTITDLAAQLSLKTKANLVNGVLSVSELPATVITTNALKQSIDPLNASINTLTTTVNGKADKSAIANFVTRQTVEGMISASEAGLVTETQLNQRLDNYMNKASAESYITTTIETSAEPIVEAIVEEALSEYVTITVANQTYANKTTTEQAIKQAKADAVVEANAYTDQRFDAHEDIGTDDYTELKNKPTINGITVDGALTTESLLIDIPEIPTNVSAFENDAGYLTEESAETDPVWNAEKADYATKEYALSIIQNTNTAVVTRKGPTAITKPETSSILLDITNFKNAVISGFTIVTEEGESFVPLFSDQGITKILKTSQAITDETTGETSIATILTLTLSDTLFSGEWSSGYVYFSQFLDTGNSPDTYWIDEDGTFFIVDANADGNPYIDSAQGILSLSSDNYTEITISDDGVLEITTDS